jgi:hypothetical protein
VFENRALRRIFGFKRDELTGYWIKLHNEELSEGKRPLGRPRRRWEYNIKIGLQVVGCRGKDWM